MNNSVGNNIYPFSPENIQALIKYYYSHINFEEAGLTFIYDYSDFLTLNELEFIIKTVESNTGFFVEKLGWKIGFYCKSNNTTL